MVDSQWLVGKGSTDLGIPVTVHSSCDVGALVETGIHHALGHAGKLFTLSGVQTGVADDGTSALGLTIPTGKLLHVLAVGTATGDAEGRMYENSTFSGGTAVTPTNKNRSSANTLTGYTWSFDPTQDVQGDLIFETYMPGGTKNSLSGSSGQTYGEWILDSGSYLFVFTNRANAAATMAMAITCYEEDDT